MDDQFVDDYQVLGIDPGANKAEIAERIRKMIKKWNPDVCEDPRAHEMTVRIVEAKHVLLDDNRRREFDDYRSVRLAGASCRTSNAAAWQESERQVRTTAAREAELDLEDLLSNLAVMAAALTAAVATTAIGAAAAATAYAWQGSDECADGKLSLTMAQRFWCGIGGWACVVCLAAPGVSILTFFCFYLAFFPGPHRKFVGLSTVLSSMILVLVVLVPLLFCLAAFIVSLAG